QQISAALATPWNPGGDPTTLCAAVALMARTGRETGRVLEKAGRSYPDLIARLRPILAAGAPSEGRAAVDTAVSGAAPMERADVRLVGILLLGSDAPPEWRREAKGLLLPWERPYIR